MPSRHCSPNFRNATGLRRPHWLLRSLPWLYRPIDLVPTFRSSYTVSAITFYELRKVMGTSKFMILVPLFDLKSLGSFRRLRCRDFKSAVTSAHFPKFVHHFSNHLLRTSESHGH